MGHFIGGDPATREAAQQIGPFWLHLLQLCDVIPRGFGDRLVRLFIAIKPARLKAVEAALIPQQVRKMAQVQDVAEHASHKEERRLRPAFAVVHRHQMAEAAFGLFGFRLIRRIARLPRVPHAFGNQRGAGADGGGLEQDRDGEFGAIGFLDHREQTYRDQGMPAKVKEPVVDAHVPHAQQFLPETGKGAFDIRFRRGIVAFQFGAIKALARAAGLDMIGLTGQRIQIHRRHNDLRITQRQNPRKGADAFFGANALGQVVVQAFLGRGQRVISLLRISLYFSLRQLLRRTKARGAVQLADVEILDLDQHRSVGIGQRDVEARAFAARAVFTGVAHPTDDLRRQRPIDTNPTVRHRHPQVLGRITIDQLHRPAGRDIQQGRMQQIACIILCRDWQGQIRDRFVLAKGLGIQHLPARAEIQMFALTCAQLATV